MENSASSSSADNSRPWQSYHTVYTNAKAGMDGVDKEKVQRIVYEMSKGSKYFENEERKEAVMRQKIETMRARSTKLSASEISHYQAVADKRIVQLEATRDLSRIWLHVDMDAFYAAVETLCNPSLKGKPMAVGSMSMISTANYEARKFGVRAAMPGFIARKLCPDLTFVPVDFEKYTHYSNLTRQVFQKYDSNFVATSLDEAYLDITGICKEQDRTGEEIAEELRARVYEETGLTCSTGVAPNRLLAKVCSDINKPNGQFVLPNNRKAVMTFISSLPIRKIGGIGKVTEHILKDVFGINTCKEILQKSGLLCALFSSSTADFFLSVGLGLGNTDMPEARSRKSISNERTFSPTDDKTLIYKKLAELAELLATDMQKEGLSGRTLTLKLKTASFEVRTRAITLQTYMSSSEEILKHASKLMKAELPVSLRLIGLRVSQFNEEKAIAPDRSQKTITNFIVPVEAKGKNRVEQSASEVENNDNSFIYDIGTDFCAGSHETTHYDLIDPSESRQLSDLDQGNCSLGNNAGEMRNNNDFINIKVASKQNTPDAVDRFRGSCQAGGPYLLEAECSSGQCHSSNVDKPRANVSENEVVPSSNQEQSIWINDYKCSICGLELPPSFVEERQEHSDFHLAERLQKEESGIDSNSITLRPRCVQKEHTASQGRRKKLKPSPKDAKHIPIDLFFVKSK